MTDTVTSAYPWRHPDTVTAAVTPDAADGTTVTAVGLTLTRLSRHVRWHVTRDAADVMRAMRHTFPKTVTTVTEEDPDER